MQQSLVQDLRQTSRLGRTTAAVAATIGVIYGYDLSNIAGALLFITDEFHLSIHQQELVTTAVVVGQVGGAIVVWCLAIRFTVRYAMKHESSSSAVGNIRWTTRNPGNLDQVAECGASRGATGAGIVVGR